MTAIGRLLPVLSDGSRPVAVIQGTPADNRSVAGFGQ